MGKNFYEILGISSPAMQKHFVDTDKAIEKLKENIEITKKLSSAMLVTEESLESMTLEEIREFSLIKPIMFIDSSFNNCINLLWLSTIKKDYTMMGNTHYDKLIFENDYMRKTITKIKESGEIGACYNELKTNVVASYINYQSFSKNVSTGLYECDYTFANDFNNYIDGIFAVYEPIFDTNGHVSACTGYQNKWHTQINDSDDYIVCITAQLDSVIISISETTYNRLSTQGDNGKLIIKGV